MPEIKYHFSVIVSLTRDTTLTEMELIHVAISKGGEGLVAWVSGQLGANDYVFKRMEGANHQY